MQIAEFFPPDNSPSFFFPSLCLFFSLLYFFSSPPVTSVPMTFEAKTLCACSLIGAYKTTLNKHSGHRGNVTSRASAMPYRFPSSRLPIDRMSRTRIFRPLSQLPSRRFLPACEEITFRLVSRILDSLLLAIEMTLASRCRVFHEISSWLSHEHGSGLAPLSHR